jgi:hypothetical protein
MPYFQNFNYFQFVLFFLIFSYSHFLKSTFVFLTKAGVIIFHCLHFRMLVLAAECDYYSSTALCWALAGFSVSRSYTQSVGLIGRGISPSQIKHEYWKWKTTAASLYPYRFNVYDRFPYDSTLTLAFETQDCNNLVNNRYCVFAFKFVTATKPPRLSAPPMTPFQMIPWNIDPMYEGLHNSVVI